jgi:hypothetical protein
MLDSDWCDICFTNSGLALWICRIFTSCRCFCIKFNFFHGICKIVFAVVFNATFNNIAVISWRSVLLVKETGGPRENYRPVASHWQTLSHNVVHLALIEIRTHNISGDIYWNNPHTILCFLETDRRRINVKIKQISDTDVPLKLTPLSTIFQL